MVDIVSAGYWDRRIHSHSAARDSAGTRRRRIRLRRTTDDARHSAVQARLQHEVPWDLRCLRTDYGSVRPDASWNSHGASDDKSGDSLACLRHRVARDEYRGRYRCGSNLLDRVRKSLPLGFGDSHGAFRFVPGARGDSTAARPETGCAHVKNLCRWRSIWNRGVDEAARNLPFGFWRILLALPRYPRPDNLATSDRACGYICL